MRVVEVANGLPLTSGRLLARNTIWNLIGQVAPMLVAIVSIPILIKGLGVERFGVLTLAWMVVGYASLFDLGLGRALTKVVADKLGSGQLDEIPALVWTALMLMAVLGVAGAICMFALTPWLVTTVLKIPTALIPETINAFYILAFSIPVVVGTAAFRGLLEAHQRFGLVNAIRVPMGISNFLGPLLVLPFSARLDATVAVLVAARIVAGWAHFVLCQKVMPILKTAPQVRRALISPLLRFGGWMTVSNIISPIMVYLDRFLIGGLLSMSAVAFYVTPYEMVTKLWLIPGALVAVLFPAFSTALATDRERAALLLDKGVRYVFLAIFPITVVIIALAGPGLRIWLGSEFARQSTRVLQWLALGVFVNSMAHLPFAFLQGAGRPDLTAKLHFVELPLYLLLLWWIVPILGIEGVAIVWVARATLDTMVIFILTSKLLVNTSALRTMSAATGVALLLMLIGVFAPGGRISAAFLVLTLGLFVPIAWTSILGQEERDVAHARLNTVFGIR